MEAITLTVPPRENSLSNYVNLFTEGVVVLEDEKKVASNRAEFLSYLRARTGLHVKVLQLSYGNPILVAEEVDNFREPQPDVVQGCCFWAGLASLRIISGQTASSIESYLLETRGTGRQLRP